MAEDEEWQASGDGDLNEDMAAAWEAELANEEAAASDPTSSASMSSGTERILNQDEIDSLLGFSMEEEARVRARVYVPSSIRRACPMNVADARSCVRSPCAIDDDFLTEFTSDNVEVSLDSISSMRFGDYLNSIPLPAILAVFKARQLDNFGLVTVDSNLIYSIVDVLLGGRRGTVAMRVEGRPYTTIERMLVTRLVEVILADARKAFAPLTEVDFDLDRIETTRVLPPSHNLQTPRFWSACGWTWKIVAGAAN